MAANAAFCLVFKDFTLSSVVCRLGSASAGSVAVDCTSPVVRENVCCTLSTVAGFTSVSDMTCDEIFLNVLLGQGQEGR